MLDVKTIVTNKPKIREEERLPLLAASKENIENISQSSISSLAKLGKFYEEYIHMYEGAEQRRVQHRIQAWSPSWLTEVRRVNILHLSVDLTSLQNSKV